VSTHVSRAPLVLTLALASFGRIAGRTPAGRPGTRETGRIVSVVPDDGALVVDTDRGPVLLIVAWEATIRRLDALVTLREVRVGDAVEWIDEAAQSVAMVDDLHLTPADAR
jgi:hypothetical protein